MSTPEHVKYNLQLVTIIHQIFIKNTYTEYHPQKQFQKKSRPTLWKGTGNSRGLKVHNPKL